MVWPTGRMLALMVAHMNLSRLQQIFHASRYIIHRAVHRTWCVSERFRFALLHFTRAFAVSDLHFQNAATTVRLVLKPSTILTD